MHRGGVATLLDRRAEIPSTTSLRCRDAFGLGDSLESAATRRIRGGEVLGVFAKLQKMTISFVMSLRLHGATGLPLDGLA
jgi:hypothetical protein